MKHATARRSHGHRGRLVLAIAGSLCLAAAAQAHPPDNTSSVHVVKPSELGRAPVKPHQHPHPPHGHTAPDNIPGAGHEHVRKRGEYGEGFRHGRSVSGPYGDIIIWEPSPRVPYSDPRTTTIDPGRNIPNQPRPSRKPVPPTGPQLEYKPDYGKPPKDRD